MAFAISGNIADIQKNGRNYEISFRDQTEYMKLVMPPIAFYRIMCRVLNIKKIDPDDLRQKSHELIGKPISILFE